MCVRVYVSVNGRSVCVHISASQFGPRGDICGRRRDAVEVDDNVVDGSAAANQQ